MQIMTKIVGTAFGAGFFAASASAGVILLPILEVTDLQPRSVFVGGMGDDGQPAQFGPIAAWTQGIFNGSGFDFLAVQFRVIEDPKEVYEPGEFESIFFDTNTTPTINDEPAPGLSKSFTLDYLNNNQTILFTFQNGDLLELLETLEYKFTILNDSGRDIGYRLQVAFFPVPTPGTLALAGVACMALARRRR